MENIMERLVDIMIKNSNVDEYTKEIEKLIQNAKEHGVNIQPYEKKIKDIVVERGISVYTCDIEVNYIPAWKLTE